jgi:pimeloyl-ACP methyl ester carboxylesterase
VLLGVSQGAAAAIEFAVRHPERISQLILYGAYSRGWARRSDQESRERYQAIVKLTRLGWGQSNPEFRQLFTSRLVPEASHEQIEWFNELCRKTATPEMATKLMEAPGQVDVQALLGKISVPTLVLHARHDETVPFAEARVLAAEIPGARLVALESRNHILLESEPAWARFTEEVRAFTGRSGAGSGG